MRVGSSGKTIPESALKIRVTTKRQFGKGDGESRGNEGEAEGGKD